MEKQKESTEQAIINLLKDFTASEKQRIKEQKSQEKKENDGRLKYRKQQMKVEKEVVVPVLENLCKLVKKANMNIDTDPCEASEESQNLYIIYGREYFPNFYFCVSSNYEEEEMLLEIDVAKEYSEDEDLSNLRSLKIKPSKLTKEILEKEFLAGMKATFG